MTVIILSNVELQVTLLECLQGITADDHTVLWLDRYQKNFYLKIQKFDYKPLMYSYIVSLTSDFCSVMMIIVCNNYQTLKLMIHKSYTCTYTHTHTCCKVFIVRWVVCCTN